MYPAESMMAGKAAAQQWGAPSLVNEKLAAMETKLNQPAQHPGTRSGNSISVPLVDLRDRLCQLESVVVAMARRMVYAPPQDAVPTEPSHAVAESNPLSVNIAMCQESLTRIEHYIGAMMQEVS